MAIAALILGIVSLCLAPVGLIAIILAFIARSQINKSERVTGGGMAVTGLILGFLGLFVSTIVILVAIGLPALGAGRLTANKLKNNTNVSGITKNLILYADSHNDEFPQIGVGNTMDDTWEARLQELIDQQDLDPKLLLNPRDNGVKPDNDQTLDSCTTMDGTVCEVSYSGLKHDSQEYKNNTNASAPIIADRQKDKATDASVWNGNRWEGSVAWGDAHAGFEEDNAGNTGSMLVTKIGGTSTSQDDIFTGTSSAVGDAVMENPDD